MNLKSSGKKVAFIPQDYQHTLNDAASHMSFTVKDGHCNINSTIPPIAVASAPVCNYCKFWLPVHTVNIHKDRTNINILYMKKKSALCKISQLFDTYEQWQ
jgi:hypothetical protein